MYLSAVSNKFSKLLGVERAHALWESKLFGHELWYAYLVGCNVRVWRNDTSASVVDSLSHHLHSEHALFLFEQLAHTALLFVLILACHRGVHEAVDSLLQLDPFLGGVSELARCFNVFSFVLLKKSVAHGLITVENLEKHG